MTVALLVTAAPEPPPSTTAILVTEAGALAATLLWFPATLAFGWYVTRIADYTMFYGSFGAGIATLVWLYITSFSALLGAELNGVLFRERQQQASESASPEPDLTSQ